ncbi:hypothetical protein [Cardinium endosymbiont of Dermatophagoides farinae]|uniref:hypothetical protein n=1 Tax=Cardinium endosymbiont of Dermatophagoides farinae TaxID=2597823 RepID=UPI001CB90A0A|nr:hypothetical protein [Cardinium endosymbiont of Dermatophagoides farinae]
MKTAWNALPTFNKAVCLAGSFVLLVSSLTVGGCYYFAPDYSRDSFMIPNKTHNPGTTWLLGTAGGITATPGN